MTAIRLASSRRRTPGWLEELAAMAGGAERLAERARELSDVGESRLAGHLAQLAWLANPGSHQTRETRAEIYERRADEEQSTMARGVFAWAAAESRRELNGDEAP